MCFKSLYPEHFGAKNLTKGIWFNIPPDISNILKLTCTNSISFASLESFSVNLCPANIVHNPFKTDTSNKPQTAIDLPC